MSKEIKASLERIKKELKEYIELFKASDGSDSKDQKKLEAMLAEIKIHEKKLETSNTTSGIPSPDGIITGKKPDPVKVPSPLDLVTFDPSLLPQLDMSWTQDTNDWLDKNSLNLRLNLLKDIIPLLRKDVKGLEDQSDKMLKLYIKNWAKANYISLDREKKDGKSDVESAMDDFFSEFKNLGKFDWKFGGGSLKIDLTGLTAELGYKHKNFETSATFSASDVKGKVSGTVGPVTGTVKGSVEYKGTEVEEKEEEQKLPIEISPIPNDLNSEEEEKETEVKYDASAKLSVKNEKVTAEIGVELDKEGKVKGSASLKIADVINFYSSSASVTFSLKGDESSWSFGIELSTSGGKEAHLSQKAASQIKAVMNKATQALKDIYKILAEGDLSIENLSTIKKEIKPHWDLVDKAIKLLSEDIKKPIKQNQLFVSFMVSGSEAKDDNPGGVVVGAGLTLTF